MKLTNHWWKGGVRNINIMNAVERRNSCSTFCPPGEMREYDLAQAHDENGALWRLEMENCKAQLADMRDEYADSLRWYPCPAALYQ